MNTIDSIFGFCVLAVIFLYSILVYFKPRIDICKQDNSYIIYLLYDKIDANNNIKKVRKYLFKIN